MKIIAKVKLNVKKVNSLSDITKNCRLFYELGTSKYVRNSIPIKKLLPKH